MALIGSLPKDATAQGLLQRLIGSEQSNDAVPGDLLASGQPEFLHPEQAFQLETMVEDQTTLVARWTVEPGYYLYRDKLLIEGSGASAGIIGIAEFPRGEVKQDEYFGRVEILRGVVEARAPITGTPRGETLKAKFRFQGCADAGLCYPPITKVVELGGPSAGTPASLMSARTPVAAAAMGISSVSERVSSGTSDITSAGVLSETDRVVAGLYSSGLGWVVLAFIGFGLLLSFTPCVLPMVPILSSIIVGRSARDADSDSAEISSRHAFSLSASYVLAMALTYAAAGVLAASFGANLQVAFQNPWVLGAFSLVFVVLAASMFGFYELQLPSALQSRLTAASSAGAGAGRGVVGAGVMGCLSALIVGPCVAAPLAGALLYIAQSGDPLRGGVALFSLGIGMGLPLLLIGTSAGFLLPRAGPWMAAVKSVFGVILLGVAIYLIERIIPHAVALGLWALLFIIAASCLGALERLRGAVSGWARLRKGVGIAALVYGIMLMVGAGTGHGELGNPLRGLVEAPHNGLTFKRVKGLDGVNAAIAAAQAERKPVMLDYYADWCVSCVEMERFTFRDRGVIASLADVVLIQVDVTENDQADQELMRKHGLFGPPAILFFGSDGRERRQYRVQGFMGAEAFTSHISGALAARLSDQDREPGSIPAPVRDMVAAAPKNR